ncbi:CinA family protein [Nitrincola alkalilacustris]|uniref:CinA family protein n=1 Tax=Nitrincola alkalilacustris TaxID=1571224 RepID=UPI00124F19AA|nr:CinA family protein [Nitrincola alkalilacustris]
MKNLAERVAQHLMQSGATMAAAESCTGGWVSQAVTALPGSSHWFDCGFVTYSNHAKQQMLGVPAALIDSHGAVSEPVVVAMAEGALQRSQATIAVSISGVAGPDGGTERKPVGTVWFAWAVRGGATVSCLSYFSGDREEVRRQAVEQALEGIIAYLPH